MLPLVNARPLVIFVLGLSRQRCVQLYLSCYTASVRCHEFLVLIYLAVIKIVTTHCFHAHLDKSIGMY